MSEGIDPAAYKALREVEAEQKQIAKDRRLAEWVREMVGKAGGGSRSCENCSFHQNDCGGLCVDLRRHAPKELLNE